MRNISSEHANFKTSLANNQASISSIQGSQMSMDQYNRSWSVRIMELQLSAEDEANPFRLVKTIYTKVVPRAQKKKTNALQVPLPRRLSWPCVSDLQ